MRTVVSILLSFATLAAVGGDVCAEEDVFACSYDRENAGEHCAFATTHLRLARFPAAMPGAAPDARHLLGTVFFAWELDRLGVAVTEWDIAARRVVRQTRIGIFDTDVRGTRAGDELHLLVGTRDTYWVVVDTRQLQVLRKVRLPHPWAASIVTDGTRTLIAFRDDSVRPRVGPSLESWLVSVFDRQGRELGSWRPEDPVPNEFGPAMAVVNGRAYAMTYGGDRRGVVELSPEATPIRQVELSPGPAEAGMTVHGGRLFATLDKELVELSPDLRVLERRTAKAPLRRVEGGPNGQLLDVCTEILSPSLRQRATMHPFPKCNASFWVGNTPVAVSMYEEPSSHVLINWIDPAFLTGEALETAHPRSPNVVTPEGQPY